jgi:CBS domain-containing protein
MKNAREIMTSNVISVTTETTIKELVNLFSEHNVSGAPVIDKTGNLIGVVTENDLIDQTKKLHIPTVITILDSIFYLENPSKMEKEMKKMAGTKVLDIYTPHPVSVKPEATIEEIATIMAEKNIHTLPVLEDGKIIGIIGKRDIIKTLVP